MRSNSIVVVRQISHHVRLRFIDVTVALLRDPLGFQASKESLHRRIIPAVATPTHALFDLVLPQTLAKGQACVMASLVRMKHDTLGMASRLVSHRQCLSGKH